MRSSWVRTQAALQARVTAWRHQLKQAEGITNISFPNLVWTKYSKDIIGVRSP